MFYFLTYLTSLICSTIFAFMKHPLAMGLMLLIQTTVICLLSGLMMKTFWFSYILFLIFLGGLLVLFIYVTSLASNEMFSFSSKIFILSLSLFLFNIFIFTFLDMSLFMNYLMNYETQMMELMSLLTPENSFMLNKLYNYPINIITIMLMVYLFLTLIAAVKITTIFEGPLRPKTSF